MDDFLLLLRQTLGDEVRRVLVASGDPMASGTREKGTSRHRDGILIHIVKLFAGSIRRMFQYRMIIQLEETFFVGSMKEIIWGKTVDNPTASEEMPCRIHVRNDSGETADNPRTLSEKTRNSKKKGCRRKGCVVGEGYNPTPSR